MILTWLNNNNGTTYIKFYKSYILNPYFIGFKNSYNHEVVQILIFNDNKIYNVFNYNDYLSKSSIPIKKNKLLTFFKMLV